jgi:hypothetical protein
MDTDATAGGTQRGIIYADALFAYLALNTGHKFMITIGGTNVFEISSTTVALTVPIKLNDGASNITTVTQNPTSKVLEFTQNYNGGGYSFTSKNLSGTPYTTSIIGSVWNIQQLTIWDSAGGIEQVRHTFTSPNYNIENSAAAGNINFKTTNASFVTTTPFIINSTNCSFTQPPLCSIAPTTGNMLCNKTYLDSVIPSLTNYVTTNTTQTITADKTFSGNIILSNGGTNTSTIDQFNYQFNLINNNLNNTIVSITGLIPATNLSCLVRTDSIAAIAPYGIITGALITGTNTMNPYNNNFYVGVQETGTATVSMLSLTTLSSSVPLTIGTVLIGAGSFIDVTYVVSLAGSTYTISRAATNVFPSASVSTIYTPLNRAYSVAVVTTPISLDYNTYTNLQCKNASSVNLNAISIKQNLTTSRVSMYGDVKLQGALQYVIGNNITATTTLTWPLSQFYIITNSAAITISFPVVNFSQAGTIVKFKRFTTAGGIVTFNCASGGNTMVAATGLVAVASTSMPIATYNVAFICIGSVWMQTA